MSTGYTDPWMMASSKFQLRYENAHPGCMPRLLAPRLSARAAAYASPLAGAKPGTSAREFRNLITLCAPAAGWDWRLIALKEHAEGVWSLTDRIR